MPKFGVFTQSGAAVDGGTAARCSSASKSEVWGGATPAAQLEALGGYYSKFADLRLEK
jgi:hypothetical protein